ncbi:hypothetical protein OR573_08575 [Halomonas sp. CH40]
MVAQVTKGLGFGESRTLEHQLPTTPCGKVKPNTQQCMVLELLRRQPMSAAELQWELPIADARAVVRDLRAKGYDIQTEIHPHPGEPKRRIKRYRLK